MMRRPGGIALVATLLSAALMLLFALTIANLATFQIQLAQQRVEHTLALEAAEAGLASAAEQLSADPDFGKNDELLEETLGNGARYRIDFEPLPGSDFSVNNLDDIGAVAGPGGRTVPPSTALILCRAWSPAGRTRTVQAVLALDALPYTVAGSGSVTGDSLSVAAAPSLAEYLTSGAGLEGHVYGGGSEVSVLLTGASSVSGDVRAVGSAEIDPTVAVAGVVREGVTPVDLPDLRIEDFDNSEYPGVQVLPAGTYGLLDPVGLGLPLPGVHVLSGLVYVDGTVVFQGPVVLQNAYVYVGNGGDLTIEGALTGKGTLFVGGKATFDGAAILDNDHKIAVFSQSGIELPVGGYFQGVLYSHGPIRTGPALTALGAVLSQGGSEASVELGAGSGVVHIPEYSAFASYWLGQGGDGAMRRVSWSLIR
ncbi:MAG: hypothetical protein HY319_25670 [Armatimonadetes bacterium]|nr:hypothetical protein [Armatimonadota bacterium]